MGEQTSCERVGIMLPASPVFPAVFMGVLWARRVAVPINFLFSGDELAPVIKDADIDLIVTTRHFEKLMAFLPARALFLEEIPLKRKLLFSLWRRFPKPPSPLPDDTAVILYTSGTTGSPKGVELSHRNLYSNCEDSIASLQMDSSERFLNVLPPFHVFGLTANVLVPMVLGASVFSIARFSPIAVAKAVEAQRISVMMAIPSMYAALLKTKSATREQFRSIHLAISGGEPLSSRVRVEFARRFGVALREGYGLTETSPVLAACSATVHRDATVGKPIRHVEIRIIDPDGKILPVDRDGEILVRSPGVMKGYYKREEETRRVKSPDGWFSTGDVGHLDADGFLLITGRAKEMLIIGGENVFPREIEAALEAHDGVLQAAVIGVPDDLRGEMPVAFVIPRSGASPSEQDLRNVVKKSIAGFKVPKRIVIQEELPVSPTGKILKRRLRELL